MEAQHQFSAAANFAEASLDAAPAGKERILALIEDLTIDPRRGHHYDGNTRAYDAKQVLIQMGAAAAPLLLEALAGGEAETSGQICEVLKQMPLAAAVPPLVRALRSDSENVRLCAQRLLREMKPEELCETLLKMAEQGKMRLPRWAQAEQAQP